MTGSAGDDPGAGPRAPVYGHFDCLRGRALCGWAWRPDEPAARVAVTATVDGVPVAESVAALHRPDLEAAGIGDGIHSFALLLPEAVMDGGEHEVAVLGEDGVPLLGSPARLRLPSLRFHPVPADDGPYRFELAVCCVAKNEGPYLLEWIAYHRCVGVEHILVFDNDSDDASSTLLSRLAGLGVLEHVPWPTAAGRWPQPTAYAEGLRRLRDQARWIAFIDLDEFLNPLEGDDVRAVLRDHADAAGLVVPWRLFGSSGEQERRDDFVIRRFTRRAAAADPLNHAVKTIVRGRFAREIGVHTPVLSEGCLVDEHGRIVGAFGDPDHHPVPEARRLVLNHYFGKSRAEWEVKKRRGRADGPGTRTDRVFEVHDRNDEPDTRILRHLDAMTAEIARLEALLGTLP